jgi:hypothetical protein
MKKISIPILCLVVTALAVGLFLSERKRAALLAENEVLRQQLETSSAADSTSPTASSENSVPPSTNTAELIRLRGEVVTLRQQKTELEKVRVENQNLRNAQAQNVAGLAAQKAQPTQPAVQPRHLSREQWAFAGYENPEAALQSVLWAGLSGNADALLAGVTPEQLERMRNEDNGNKTEAEVLQRLAKQLSNIKSYQILKTDLKSADDATLFLYIDGAEGSEQTPRMKMRRVGNTWRLAGPDRGGDK